MPLLYIAGPCVIEDAELTASIARELKSMTDGLDVDFVFKASFDKANRTSVDAYRGPGLADGLRILSDIKQETGLRILSDVHEPGQVTAAAEVLDVIQIPAFLCRQTDLLVEAGRSGKIVNIKKAQFAAPQDMQYAAEKVASTGNNQIWVTERGTTFGYNNLVVDFRSLDVLAGLGYPVIFDATHAVQTPSLGGKSGGNREYVAPLARAAAAYGIDGLFTEVHPEPEKGKSDAANMLPLSDVPALLNTILAIRDAATR